MVGVEEEKRVFEEMVVLEEVEDVLCADEDSVRGGPDRVSFLTENLNGLDLLRPGLQYIVLDLLINLLLTFTGTLLKRSSQFLLTFHFLGPKIGVKLKFMFVEENAYFGVR